MVSVTEEDGSTIETDETDEDNPGKTLYASLVKSIDKCISSYTRQSASLEKELDKARSSESMMHRANLITANLYRIPDGSSLIKVEDWENDGQEVDLILDVDNYKSAKDEAEALFVKARKMKRGSAVVGELLTKNKDVMMFLEREKKALVDSIPIADDDAIVWNNEMEDMLSNLKTNLIQNCERRDIKISFPSSSSSHLQTTSTHQQPSKRRRQQQQQQHQKPKPPSFRTLRSPQNHIILVGRNSRDNESLSFRIAKPSDVWMHARGCPGAHVLLKVRRGDPPPDDATLLFAARLAAFYSEARVERKAVVSVADPRFIRKPRGGGLGSVMLQREMKSLVVDPRDVPEELKAKREESGVYGWEEGGNRIGGGKVKNRKRTLGVRRKEMEKKRDEKRQKKENKRRGGRVDDVEAAINFYDE